MQRGGELMDKNILSPHEIVEAVIGTGKAKADKRFFPLLVLAILAGAFIAFAAEASNMAAYNLLGNPNTFGIGRMIAGLVFTGGLSFVVLSGAELFTGNTLICVSVYEKQTTVLKMIRNLAIVYVGNLIGALLIAFMMSQTGLFNSSDGMLGAMTVKIALNKVNLSFWAALISGILCNWLVCLAVWISHSSNSLQGKLMGVFFPIWLFATSGFEHCVANMYYIPAGILASEKYYELAGTLNLSDLQAQLNWTSFFTSNLIPVTIGNIIGGVVFVGTAYWFALHRPSKEK